MENNSKSHILKNNESDIVKMSKSKTAVLDISKKYNVSKPTVRKWLSSLGLNKHRTKGQVTDKEYKAPKYWSLVNSVLNRSQGRHPV